MIFIFRKYVLGGDTGSSELALLVCLGTMVLVTFASIQEARGIEMDRTFSLLTVVVPAVLVHAFGAMGLNKAKQAGWNLGRKPNNEEPVK